MASSLSHCLVAAPPPTSRTPSICPFHKSFRPKAFGTPLVALPRTTTKSSSLQTKATLDDKGQISTSPSVLVPEEKQPTKEVEDCVRVLKNAAKTRKVPPEDILNAFSVIEKARGKYLVSLKFCYSSALVKKLNRGRYFPITAVQRFDAAGKRIENGVYLGPLGNLTFEGRLSWKKRILAFIFERIRIKIGPLNPFEISFKGEDEREPSNKDPFFIWFYIDEEIAVARGRSGGTAFWVRCQRVG
ncbi:UNVERIFIED_CONTAM: hypothetical protein Scaly_0179800 [Sesamum calycinum]|uniref:Uncharacterized protein n=1 Tax=Sesamum calycinum TaxID=2727403 RepID=A0AAW2SXJ2_9LAMI